MPKSLKAGSAAAKARGKKAAATRKRNHAKHVRAGRLGGKAAARRRHRK